jgi:hypothetical protein
MVAMPGGRPGGPGADAAPAQCDNPDAVFSNNCVRCHDAYVVECAFWVG